MNGWQGTPEPLGATPTGGHGLPGDAHCAPSGAMRLRPARRVDGCEAACVSPGTTPGASSSPPERGICQIRWVEPIPAAGVPRGSFGELFRGLLRRLSGSRPPANRPAAPARRLASAGLAAALPIVLSALFAAPAQAQSVLVSNSGQLDFDTPSIEQAAQSFTTGSNTSGYTLTSIVLNCSCQGYTSGTVTLHSGSRTGSKVADFTGSVAMDDLVLTPTQTVTLSANTTYVIVTGDNFDAGTTWFTSTASEAVALSPICPEGGLHDGCWLEISNRSSCYLWYTGGNVDTVVVTWSGGCTGGKASGTGDAVWNLVPEIDEWGFVFSGHGPFLDGKQHGHWEIVFQSFDHEADPYEGTSEGSFFEGQRHGMWKQCDQTLGGWECMEYDWTEVE